MIDEYESYQLDMILAEYASRGYRVRREVRVRVRQRQFVFDGVAERDDPAETVIIELANVHRFGDNELAARAEAIRQAFGEGDEVLIDLRYVDTRITSASTQANRSAGRPARAPRLSDAAAALSRQHADTAAGAMLMLWREIAALIRQFAETHLPEGARDQSVLDLYNMLLMPPFRFVPAESRTRAKGMKKDLFDLRHEVDVALEGGAVTLQSIRQLERHLKSLQAQMTRHRKSPIS